MWTGPEMPGELSFMKQPGQNIDVFFLQETQARRTRSESGAESGEGGGPQPSHGSQCRIGHSALQGFHSNLPQGGARRPGEISAFRSWF